MGYRRKVIMATEPENQIITLNKAINNYNLLQLRLDPSNILNEAKMFLNAEIEVVSQDESGNFKREVIPIGEPKANKRGIASILNWMQNIINPQVVQGNFPMDNKGTSTMYNQYVMECQINLGDILFSNCYEYGIKDNELPLIIDSMMNLIIPFMTRLIGNKERESYGETFKEVNSNIPQNKGGFNIFKS
jgi:hypothetical protein